MTIRNCNLSLPLAGIALAMLPGRAARADLTLITSLADLAENDAVNWSLSGSSGAYLTNPFNISSQAENQLSVSQLNGSFELLSGAAFGGNFGVTPADTILYTRGGGPITISFSQGVSAAGAQIEANYYGSYVARLTAYDSNGNSLGSVTEGGISQSGTPAIFLGGYVSSPNIAQIVFSLDSAPPGGSVGDFGIDSLGIRTASGVPESNTFVSVLLMFCTGGAGWLVRHRQKKVA